MIFQIQIQQLQNLCFPAPGHYKDEQMIVKENSFVRLHSPILNRTQFHAFLIRDCILVILHRASAVNRIHKTAVCRHDRSKKIDFPDLFILGVIAGKKLVEFLSVRRPNACGSSGGSAASVANATSLASLGTDTGGSIRLPSGVCGLVGMRPTIGRVSLNGIVPLAWSLDACGPITRSIRDNALMLGVLAGEEPGDPSTAKRPGDDFSRTIDRGVKGLRIGILPEVLFQKDQPAVVAAVQRALETFRSLGAEIVKCRVNRLELMPKAWSAVCYVEATSFHQKNLRTCPLDYGDDVRVLFQAGEFISGTTYVHAQRYRRWLREQFRTLFREQVDLLLFPTLPFTAVPIGDYELIIHGVKENVLPLSGTYVCYAPTTGLPALTLPCGLDERGLPVGLQLLGDAFREDVCYQAGAAFESVFHLYDRLPGIRPESFC